jgi:phage shock protein C
MLEGSSSRKEPSVTIHETLRRHRLERPFAGRLLGGVCAGLARRVGITPWGARVLFVLVLMVLPGSQLVVYPVLWVLMPSERAPQPWAGPTGPVPGENPAHPAA